MRLGENGGWYHKPGKSILLKYKYTPSATGVWLCEGCIDGEYFYYSQLTYDSSVYFIYYDTDHEYEYVYCGTVGSTHYHIQTCTICGETTGSKVACSYKGTGTNCLVCGHNKNAALTSLSTNQYDKVA